jgi:hypothetical protein
LEYIYYILIILVLLAILIAVVRLPGSSRLANNQMELARDARKRKMKKQEAQAKAESRKPTLASGGNSNYVIKRELARIPAPWGWPQHEKRKGFGKRVHDFTHSDHDLSDSLHRLSDKLFSQKQTVQDAEYQKKKDANLRVLLEDRHSPQITMSEIEYQKVRAPLLRDPGAPHDQMDNFPSGKGDQLTGKLKSRSRTQTGGAKSAGRDARRTNLKNLKTPWGW